MAKTIGEAIQLLHRIGHFDINGVNVDMNTRTEHKINHKFREHIIVPMICITNNIEFFINKGDRYITFSDGVRGLVVDSAEKHICDLEENIKSLYGISAWDFICKWHKSYKDMESMNMVCITCRKVN